MSISKMFVKELNCQTMLNAHCNYDKLKETIEVHVNNSAIPSLFVGRLNDIEERLNNLFDLNVTIPPMRDINILGYVKYNKLCFYQINQDDKDIFTVALFNFSDLSIEELKGFYDNPYFKRLNKDKVVIL